MRYMLSRWHKVSKLGNPEHPWHWLSQDGSGFHVITLIEGGTTHFDSQAEAEAYAVSQGFTLGFENGFRCCRGGAHHD